MSGISQKIRSVFIIWMILILGACQLNSSTNNHIVSPESETITTRTPKVSMPSVDNIPAADTPIVPTQPSTPIPTIPTTPLFDTDFVDPTLPETRLPVETMPAFSPLPTLTSNEAKGVLLDLLLTNAGCHLPCWWGATPGQTQWGEVDVLLASMNAEYYEPNSRSHAISLPYIPDELAIEPPLGIQIFYGTERDIIQVIDIEFAPTPNYFLHSILTDYGEPEEILIDTMPAPREGYLPFRLVLIYWEIGVAVRFFDDAEVIDGMVTGCFPADGQQYPSLFLWAIENEELTTVELLEGSGFAGTWEGDYYKHLDEVTNFDISAFYETYKEPSDTGCIQTPQEAWFS